MENFGMEGLHNNNEGEWESLSKLLTFDEPDLTGIENSSITNNHLNLIISSNTQSISSNYNFNHFSDHFDREFSHLTWQENVGTLDHGANEAFLASIFAHDHVNINNINEATMVGNEDGSCCSHTDNSDDNNNNNNNIDNYNHNYNQNATHLELLVGIGSDHQPKRKYPTAKVESKKKARAPNHKGKKTNVVEEEIMESENDKENEEENNGNNKELNEQNNGNGEVWEDNGTIGFLENGDGENSTTSKGKKRADRGAATDPQSLYARKRRQRINERLRILQSLVPNGTKVDISTMLEEAVHYVKFMQLQIRLLSSDDLWMYAPIAYNGFDISHFRHYSPFQQP